MLERVRLAALMGASALTLTACLGEGTDNVTRAPGAQDSLSVAGASATQTKINQESAVIRSLSARRSVLEAGSPFDEVASAVLAANARSAESTLRAARLRAEAASKNWLPKLGPDISLSSLTEVVASLLLEATIFDHGRKRAERDFAKADVEVAAVSLAEDSNARVLTALDLYLTAQEGREKARLDGVTLRQMGHFRHIISERVRGGVSDRGDLTVIDQKLAEIRASERRNAEAARTALAELDAMAARPLGEVSGLNQIKVSASAARPLAVIRAEAERDRKFAEVTAARAGRLPGIVASGRVTGDSDSDGALRTEGAFGLGTGAQLKALEAARQAAERDLERKTEDATRVTRRLESEISAKSRQAAEAAQLTRAAKANLDLFQEQADHGQRQVLDVVQVYETFARQQEAEITLKYEAVRARLELARALGLLADGEAI